ncbi:hypothetical protein HYY73_04065 [Candidatus Woesearchaeota archaeon]|nr:hypothetical protein [Candidatus Woesearchaeota archaeon]
MAGEPTIRYWAGPWSDILDTSYFVNVEGPGVASEIKTVANKPEAAGETLRLFCEYPLRLLCSSLFSLYRSPLSNGDRVQLANGVPPNSGIHARQLSPQEEQQFLKALGGQ